MIIYTQYVNSHEYTWYDSSNVLFSECFDTKSEKKPLKIVFKGGRTYVYKDVEMKDYLQFRTAESQGKAVSGLIIKKYEAARLPDTSLESLKKLQRKFMEMGKKTEEAFFNLAYKVESDRETGLFRMYMGDSLIYEGKEGEVSLFKLLKSMNIRYAFEEKKIESVGEYPENEGKNQKNDEN